MSAEPLRRVAGPLRRAARPLRRVSQVRGGDRRPGGRRPGLDTPLDRRPVLPTPQVDAETFGRWSERFARFMGTAQFIAGMTVFVVVWLAWNTFAPTDLQYDPKALNYTLLTLILSLQASYAAPLILLAQNRQADRDRVQFEQDRQRSERNLADTEYLAREVAALRIALRDVATRDFVRSELRDLLEELLADRADTGTAAAAKGGGKGGKKSKNGPKSTGEAGGTVPRTEVPGPTPDSDASAAPGAPVVNYSE